MGVTPLAATQVRAAAVQIDVRLGDNDGNLERMLERLGTAAGRGAQLVVFPECALSGYCFGSPEEAIPFADRLDSAESRRRLGAFAAACDRLHVTGILGFLEYDEPYLHNSALICVPGAVGGASYRVYRKTHLPTLGVDRYVRPGDSLETCATPFGRMGTLICYDVRFSEAARVLGLQGADVIALPTNWPEGAESSPEFITRARAWENRVYVVAANRVGVERGRRFIGRSQIVAPSGAILCEAGGDEETILYADLDLSAARRKRVVIEPGEWELDITSDRRPELYDRLTETSDRLTEKSNVEGTLHS